MGCLAMKQRLLFRFCLLAALLLALAAWPGDARALRSTEPPPATAAPTPEPVPEPLPLAADNTPDVPVVLRVSRFVGKERGRDANPWLGTAERGDDVYVHAQDLEAWIRSVRSKVPDGKTDVLDLVIYLNGTPLKGVHPNQFFAYQEWLNALDENGQPVATERPVHYLRFALECTADSKAEWQRLLRKPDFEPRAMEVSVGFDNGQVMRTYVALDKRQKFSIITMPPGRFWSGVAIILGSLALFLALVRDTDIIRDHNAALRPDGRWPYSLARAQMAFWFFLVLTSFFFLWVLTGAMDTLNASVLALLGISAGTALGAAFVDSVAAGPRPETAGHGLAAVDLSQSDPEIQRQISQLLGQAEARLQTLETERGAIDKENEAALDRNGMAIKETHDHVNLLKKQRDYFRQPAWKGVLYDLLVEKGFVSFHRFQILVWTVVLGLMFVAGVYSETAMPEFNATLLGLLGISGGTYVGFKLPALQQKG